MAAPFCAFIGGARFGGLAFGEQPSPRFKSERLHRNNRYIVSRQATM